MSSGGVEPETVTRLWEHKQSGLLTRHDPQWRNGADQWSEPCEFVPLSALRLVEEELRQALEERDRASTLSTGWAAESGRWEARYNEAVADRDRLAEALREIADQDWVENVLDPQWAARIAEAALSPVFQGASEVGRSESATPLHMGKDSPEGREQCREHVRGGGNHENAEAGSSPRLHPSTASPDLTDPPVQGEHEERETDDPEREATCEVCSLPTTRPYVNAEEGIYLCAVCVNDLWNACLTTEWRSHAKVLAGPPTTNDPWLPGDEGRDRAIAEAHRMSRVGQYTEITLQSRRVTEAHDVTASEARLIGDAYFTGSPDALDRAHDVIARLADAADGRGELRDHNEKENTMSTTSADTSNNDLIGETDARIWAGRFTDMVKDNVIDPGDEDTMLTWFACAIESGRMTVQGEHEQDGEHGHSKACDDNAFQFHAATGGDAECISSCPRYGEIAQDGDTEETT